MRAPLSAKAARRYNRGVAIARALYKDEGSSSSRGEIPVNEINHETNQGGRFGRRVSRTGGAGAERQESANHINDRRNARSWPGGVAMKSRSQRTRVKGGLAGSVGNPGNWYSGGRGRSNG